MGGKGEERAAKDLAAVLAKIGSWDPPHDQVGLRMHRVIQAAVPALAPRLWYGMPGYALGGPVLCYFRLDEGLMTFGLTEKTRLVLPPDAPTQLIAAAWYLRELDGATEERIAAIVREAVG